MPSLRVLAHAWRAYRRNKKNLKHEPEVPYLKDLLSGAPLCLHVGASDGRHSYVMAEVAPKARIVAFEPSPFTFRVLKTTLAWHGLRARVTAVNAAVSDQPGEMTLVTPRKSSGRMGRAYAFIADKAPDGAARPDVEDKGVTTERVPVIALDSYVREHKLGQVDFIRMDIEGAEAMALAGAADILERDRPNILLEIHPEMLRERFGGSADNLVAGLLSRGYRMFALSPAGVEERTSVVPGLPWKDYFFLHRERALPQGAFSQLMAA